MKKSMALCALVCVSWLGLAAQDKVERPMIEVTGSATTEVLPNEFTFKITLLERIDNKQKITIEQQESRLRSELATLGIDVSKDLTIFDVTSAYVRQKKVKDVLGQKEYRLVIRDLNKIAQLQELVDRINVSRLELEASEHSDIIRLRRETKIGALKAAKEKAEYLLASIGQKLGAALYVREVEERGGFSVAGASANSNTFILDGARRSQPSEPELSGLSFSSITIRYEVIARFEIK